MPEFYIPSGEWILHEGVLGDEIEEMRMQAKNLLDEHREAAVESTATLSARSTTKPRTTRTQTPSYTSKATKSPFTAPCAGTSSKRALTKSSNPAYTKLTPGDARKQLTLKARELCKHVKLGAKEHHCSPREVRFISNTFPVEDGDARPAKLKITAKTHKPINPSSDTPVPLRILTTPTSPRGVRRSTSQGWRTRA